MNYFGAPQSAAQLADMIILQNGGNDLNDSHSSMLVIFCPLLASSFQRRVFCTWQSANCVIVFCLGVKD